MKTIRTALSFLLLAAALCSAQTNTAAHFAGATATISNTLSVAGGDARGSGSFAHGFSMATGEYSVALGFGAMALHNKSFVWADRTNPPVVSTAPGQFIVHATNGIYLLGGKIYGNAAGLTGVSVNAVSGLGTAALKPTGYFATAAQGQTANAAYNTANSALQSDGRIDWSGTQNAAGQSLTNLQSAFAFAVTQGTFQVTENRMTGLSVGDPYGYGFPYTGVYSGDAGNGFFGAASITRDEWWNWTITWSHPSENIGWVDFWGSWNTFYASGWYASFWANYDEGNNPIMLYISSGTPFDGTYYGDIYSGFSRDDGAYSLTTDGCGSWWFNRLASESVSLGWFGDGGTPSGWFSAGSSWWTFSIDPYSEDVTWDETRPVTNAIPFEVADGRHAWVGSHNAGGFDLANVGTLQAQVVVGDGSGLFNVGLAGLDVASVDLRYLLKAGDTVAGDLEVNGALTVGGRPVATLTSIPPQGDISMGSFTNALPQP